MAVLQSKAWAWQACRGKQDDWRGRGSSWAGMAEENDWRYTALLVDRPNDVATSRVEAGSRSAGRRRGGAAAGQSDRVLRAGPVRDQEARSTVSRLTMGSPAVQIPRAARRSSWSLEEAGWSSAGAAVAVQSRRRKSCELACRGSRERARRRRETDGQPRQAKPPQLCWAPIFTPFASGIVKGTASPGYCGFIAVSRRFSRSRSQNSWTCTAVASSPH